MNRWDRHLDVSWWVLKIALGLMAVLAGLDKYFNKLADWEMYLSPYATKVLPVSAVTFMHIVGVIEIIAGIIVFSRWTKIGGYIVMAWLICIALNLVTTGMFFDIAVRDLELAAAAFVLAQLSTARGETLVVQQA
ncbi:MAG TPA: hypothetical protein VN612_07210 [Acidobacteriaceae bacterium]|nr:hypothetical protein [Acidobacteriaceae bacterium]